MRPRSCPLKIARKPSQENEPLNGSLKVLTSGVTAFAGGAPITTAAAVAATDEAMNRRTVMVAPHRVRAILLLPGLARQPQGRSRLLEPAPGPVVRSRGGHRAGGGPVSQDLGPP